MRLVSGDNLRATEVVLFLETTFGVANKVKIRFLIVASNLSCTHYLLAHSIKYSAICTAFNAAPFKSEHKEIITLFFSNICNLLVIEWLGGFQPFVVQSYAIKPIYPFFGAVKCDRCLDYTEKICTFVL